MYKPLTFGRLLDRSFRVYRSHFVKWMLLTILLFGPFYLLYGWIFSDTLAASFDFTAHFGNEAISTRYGEQPGLSTGLGPLLFFLLIMVPLAAFALAPVAFSSVTIMVKALYDREEPGIRTALKQTFKRFWPLFGNAHLFGLIMLGIYFVLVIAVVIIVLVLALAVGLGSGLGAFAKLEPGPGFIVGIVVLYAVFILLIYALIGFFAIRWGYFVPAVVLDRESIGFGRSWRLTRGSFWRIFWVYFILSLVVTAFYLVYIFAIQAWIPFLVLKILLPVLIYLLLCPLYLTTYAVSYWDLRVRTEGLDLERMLHSLQNPKDRETGSENE